MCFCEAGLFYWVWHCIRPTSEYQPHGDSTKSIMLWLQSIRRNLYMPFYIIALGALERGTVKGTERLETSTWWWFTTSVNGVINKCIDAVVNTVTIRTYPNQITSNIRNELKAKAAAFTERTLIRMLIRNPAMTSDEPLNRESINTGLRSNPTTPALMLDGCGRPSNYDGLQKETQPRAAQWC
jgi:hypothetical protein